MIGTAAVVITIVLLLGFGALRMLFLEADAMSGIPAWAVQGAKVACVISPTKPHWRVTPWRNFIFWLAGHPIAGCTYTILHAKEQDGRTWLAIKYFHQFKRLYGIECFRPLVADDDEIEAQLFRSKGLKVDHREEERA